MPARRRRSHALLAPVLVLALVGGGCPSLSSMEDVARGGLFELSVEEERELGRRFLEEVEKELPLVEDAEVLAYVRAIGAEIRRSAGTRPFDYTFAVVRDRRINAFAGPAGHIFVHSGLIEAVASDDELASVLAHEVAHVRNRHIARRMERAQKVSLASLAGVLAGAVLAASGGGDAGDAGAAVLMGSVAAGPAAQLAHSREMEDEADRAGLRILADAGYAPTAMASFFGTLLDERRRSPISAPPYLLTHPEVADRKRLVEDMTGFVARSPEPPLAAGHLRRVQARLAVLSRGPSEAERMFGVRLQRGEGTIEDELGLALALRGLGRLHEAREHVDVVLAAWPDYARGYLLEGQILEELGDLEEAVPAVREARRRAPGDPEIERTLARLYRSLDRDDEAEALIRSLLERSPDDPRAHHLLGVVLGEQGEALRRQGSDAEADRHLGEAHVELGRAELLQRQRARARFHLEVAAGFLGPSDPLVEGLRARIEGREPAPATGPTPPPPAPPGAPDPAGSGPTGAAELRPPPPTRGTALGLQ